MGDSQFTHDWSGATYQFSTAANRDQFEQSPESYAPQYGGFCSFAVSKGVTADISPTAWHIEDGNLYLFADENVRNDWVDGIDEGSIQASSENWSKR
jgi:YHS domain-containing protein